MFKYKFLFICSLLITFCSSVFAIELKITSDQIEFLKKKDKVIFKDNVKINQKENVLFADLAIKDEKNGIVEMRGNINGYYVVDETGTVKLNTEYARYDIKKNEMELWGNPFVVYKTSSGAEVKIHSDKVLYQEDLKIFEFFENVSLTYKGNIIKGDYAQYYYKDKKVVFKKSNDIVPVISCSDKHKADFLAEEMTFFLAERKLILESNVYCKIFPGE